MADLEFKIYYVPILAYTAALGLKSPAYTERLEEQQKQTLKPVEVPNVKEEKISKN